jgi:hypothetical protein
MLEFGFWILLFQVSGFDFDFDTCIWVLEFDTCIWVLEFSPVS